MKNKLLKGLFGLGLGLSAFAMTTSVHAMVSGGDSINGGSISGENTLDREVTVKVGEVDTAVYNVKVSWTSMQFNYKYNEEAYLYEWVVSDSCYKLGNEIDGVTVEDKQNAQALYNDETCSVEYTGNIDEVIENEVVYAKATGGKIVIEDNSTLGSVTPSVTWNSSEGYEQVNANIYSLNMVSTYSIWCNDDYCTGSDYLIEQGSPVSSDFRFDNKYYLLVMLVNAAGSNDDFLPTTGDTIGKVTISLTANK